MTRPPILPPDLGQQLRQRRADLGLTRQALGERIDLSASTIKHIELGRHRPSLSTLLALAQVLPELGALAPAAPAPWVAPGLSTQCLHLRLQQQLQQGGPVDPALLYLDGALPRHRPCLPVAEVAAALPQVAGGGGWKMLALGCGSAAQEVELAQGVPLEQLVLMDTSEPLLSRAYLRALEALGERAGRVCLMALLGDLRQLATYRQLHAPGRRLVTLLGGTLGQWTQETQILLQALSWLGSGDMVVLDVALGHPKGPSHDVGRLPPTGLWSWLQRLLPEQSRSKKKGTVKVQQGCSSVPGAYTLVYEMGGVVLLQEQRYQLDPLVLLLRDLCGLHLVQAFRQPLAARLLLEVRRGSK